MAKALGPEHFAISDADHPDMPLHNGECRVQQRVQPLGPDDADHADHPARAADLPLAAPLPRPARSAQNRQNGEPGHPRLDQRIGQARLHHRLDGDLDPFRLMGLHVSGSGHKAGDRKV